jgi:hypothetical protein
VSFSGLAYFDGFSRLEAIESWEQRRDQRLEIRQSVRWSDEDNDGKIVLRNILLIWKITVNGDENVEARGSQTQ